MKITSKKNNRVLSLTALAALGSVFLASCGVSWQEYKSSEGKYSVEMPGKFAEKTKDISAVATSTMQEKSISTGLRNSIYTVSYIDYPENYANLIGQQANIVNYILSQTLDAYTTDTGSDPNAVKKESIEINSVPCKRFQSPLKVDDINGEIQGIICWNENRLYQVIAAGTKEDIDQNAAKFLDSFKIEQ